MFPEVIVASDSCYIPNIEKDFHNRIKRAFGTILTLLSNGSPISENIKHQILREGTSEDTVEQIIPQTFGGSGTHKNNCFPIAKCAKPLSNEWKDLKIGDGYCIEFEYIFYYDNCCKTHKRPTKTEWTLKTYKDTVFESEKSGIFENVFESNFKKLL